MYGRSARAKKVAIVEWWLLVQVQLYYIYKFLHSFLCLIYTHGFISISAKMGVEFF